MRAEPGRAARGSRWMGQGWSRATSGPMSFLPLERSRFEGGPAEPRLACSRSSNSAMASAPILHSHSHVLRFASQSAHLTKKSRFFFLRARTTTSRARLWVPGRAYARDAGCLGRGGAAHTVCKRCGRSSSAS